MRIEARLAVAKLALLSGSGTTSGTADGEGIFRAGFFLHRGKHNAKFRHRGTVNFDQFLG